MKIQSEQEMLDFGKSFAKNLKSPTSEATVIELVGDVGAGKTTFVRGLARGLNINQPITSPSYTISKTYALPDGRILTHYDFYRLPDPGLMVDDLSEKLSDPHQIIIIEWGESIQSLLPPHHHIININYTDENTREVIL
ncbi:tRNA (adenosine(37)-N6)-threonylcarbamoyltransferase complex ATPase subunit type 1 TsaE [Candidatus Saccharibacteria bacterium]|nr:tRNA (adenosine(37)-N6)-threonylcarbamoyltransferase complex ATPase subunit type 1 TsaE [Candidatus Saccharibacteria bacterium]